MDKRKNEAFNYLKTELGKTSFRGSPLKFGLSMGDNSCWSSSNHVITIYFSQQKAFTDLDPEYSKKLRGYIQIIINDEYYEVNMACPSTLVLSIIDETRYVYYIADRENKPVQPFGTKDYCDYKHNTTKAQTSATVLRWVNTYLEKSYNMIVEGRAWMNSDLVKNDAKEYIEHNRIISKIRDQISELNDKISAENRRYNSYDSKYRSNFERERKSKLDF
jgi:hypothetical protein